MDTLSENKDVFYSMKEEKVSKRNKKEERKNQTDFTFAIDAAGDITLIRPIRPDVIFYQIIIQGTNFYIPV